MGETAVMAKQEQEDKNVVIKDMWKQLDSDITRLQNDIVEQNDVNNTQQNRIDHLEKVVEDLVDRIMKIEDNT
jgi:predicted  nucleic acid-binding Zn-ribbon protein